MTNIPLHRVLERGERGDRVCNVDLSEYGQRDRHGRLECIHVPDRLMPNLQPGLVSESSAADAFDAGRAAERKQEADSELPVARSNPRQGIGWKLLKTGATLGALIVFLSLIDDDQPDALQSPSERPTRVLGSGR